jgi:hypothetical protein
VDFAFDFIYPKHFSVLLIVNFVFLVVLRLSDHQIPRSPDHPILMSINLRSSRGNLRRTLVCGSAALCLRASVVDLLFDLPLIF